MPDATATAAETFSIAPATGVGAVYLAVTDGEQALAFYRDVLGLALLSRTGEEIRLGAEDRELVVLTPGASRQVLDRTTGLYHLALLVPDRREFARVVGRLMSLRYPNSPTDHVMTKSDYLWDPDGNGIEVYAESPEDGVFGFENGMFMARDASGALRSGRDPIDLDALFGELRPGDRLDAGMPPETRMGHVHLHVRNLRDAVDFYHGLIGFDVMGLADRWGAAFVSAGGYHHHLGLNIWAGQGAPPRPVDAAGLRHFTIELPDAASLAEVASRLTEAGMTLTEAREVPGRPGWWLQDPSHNRIHLTMAPGAN